jgi:protein-S-isoprenylcysteine O-methyltransferase Ste14
MIVRSTDVRRAKGLLPPSYALVCLVAALALHFLFPIPRIIPAPYVLLGIPLVVLGAWLSVWAENIFKQQNTTVKPFEESSALVVEGPFRFSRHPMYLGFVIVMLGVAVLLGSAVAFLAPIAMFATLGTLFIPHEEKSLEKTFGREYVDYKKRVRRWI